MARNAGYKSSTVVTLGQLNKVILALFAIALFGWGCKSNDAVSGRDISSLYRAHDESIIEVQYSLVHEISGESKLNYRIAPNGLMVLQDEAYQDYQSYSIRYRIYSNYSSAEPIDSGYVVMKKVEFLPNHPIDGVITINIPKGRNHVIDLSLKDLGSKRLNRQYLDVQNSNNFSRQSIEVYNSFDEFIYGDYIHLADSLKIFSQNTKDLLYVNFYDREFPIAAPPFAAVSQRAFNFTPDKVFRLKRNQANCFKMYVTQNGIYQINRDSISKTGGALYYFGASFPEAKTINDLLLPLRYITTTDEYEKLTSGDNIKKNIDTYWLGVGGSPDRAKSLLQEYYGRVEKSNIYFSSYIEGWKTDRGMCYIVFGPPSAVYRSTASETWIYGEEGKYNALSLTFTRVVNPFSNNDFRLNRNGSLKSPWYRGVEFWRQGRIITY